MVGPRHIPESDSPWKLKEFDTPWIASLLNLGRLVGAFLGTFIESNKYFLSYRLWVDSYIEKKLLVVSWFISE